METFLSKSASIAYKHVLGISTSTSIRMLVQSVEAWSGSYRCTSSESALSQAAGDREASGGDGDGGDDGEFGGFVAEGNSPAGTQTTNASSAVAVAPAAVEDLKGETGNSSTVASVTNASAAAAAAVEDLKGAAETDIELGFPASHIITYWKMKEEKKFTRRMNDSRKPPPDYVTTVTIHSAVSFLDELMMLTDYVTRDWQLYAVCCLSVAAKYEEAECNMPMISELADAAEISLTTPIVTRGELDLVQNRLQWDVSRVTAMHFLGYYTSQGVTMPEDMCQGRRLVEKVVTYMNKYVDFFANLCQQDYQFQRYRPSHIAAAAVLAARRALCIKPLWRNELTELTGYTVEDIVECGDELWNLYEEMFPSHRPLRTDASAALKKAAEQQQQGSAVASSDPHAPSSGSNPAMVANARGSGAGEDDARAGYDATA
eukprot:jgi/Undpi1/3988/HiC_scaffold_16.g07356.m1